MDKRTFLQTLALASMSVVGGNALAQGQKQGPKHTLVGQDSEERVVNLDSFTDKVCLVTFFTAGCSLCTKDLKLMREFYQGNAAKKFMMLGVNLDETKNDFTEYVRLVSLSVPPSQRFPILWRNAPGHTDSFGPIAKKPTHFVLDKTHHQVLRREGAFQPDDWDSLWTLLA